MSTCKKRLSCKSARSSYYDLLNAETAGSVPEEVHEHVASCAKCQSEMNRLRELLFSAGSKQNDEQTRRDNAVIELLRLHFAWAGRPVRCTDARPFLPSMADPLLKIRVQTPIAAHVENCKACSEELSTLIDSGLRHKQLCRISRILAGDCEVGAESPELQAVTPMVKGMMDRPDSGIATLFTLGKSNGKNGKDDSHAFRPAKVKVIGANKSSKHSRKASVLKLKQYLKPALAAAAVILIGIAIFFQTPPVKAVAGPEEISKAIREADNIHISLFMPGDTQPVQEKWVSRSLGILMGRTGQEFVLWDIANNLKKKKEISNSPTENVTLSKENSAKIKRTINGTLDIIPFEDVFEIPPDAKWIRVTDKDGELAVQGCEVYDLSWSERNRRGEEVLKKWRYLVESGTGMPIKVQSYAMSPADEEYMLYRNTFIEYVSEGEIEAIEEASF